MYVYCICFSRDAFSIFSWAGLRDEPEYLENNSNRSVTIMAQCDFLVGGLEHFFIFFI